ncbi:hypothetical protein [Rhizobium leguminosarum]|uniref:hypothetical protein n=1 Tax=Rhizobium leguminosarum TaxID=384 RepID=UPI0013E9113F|nr:hypothetical protein [Rhizobium leguminosarum]
MSGAGEGVDFHCAHTFFEHLHRNNRYLSALPYKVRAQSNLTKRVFRRSLELNQNRA